MEYLSNIDEDEQLSKVIRQILGYFKAGDLTLGETENKILTLSKNRDWKTNHSSAKPRLN